MKERILTRARTLTFLLKDFALGAILAAGLADVYIFERFAHYIERSEAKQALSDEPRIDPKRAGNTRP